MSLCRHSKYSTQTCKLALRCKWWSTTALSSLAKTDMGQLVDCTVKTGHCKLALADYRASADTLDKGLKDLPVFFFSTWPHPHLLPVYYTAREDYS